MIDTDNSHKQVPAKVTAYVDEGIKELVEILNSFDKVSTFESCQARQGELAFIYMTYGDYDKAYSNGKKFSEMTHFVNKLARLFAKYTGDSIDGGHKTSISIEWWGDKRFPFISVEFPFDYVDEVTNIFACVQKEFENGK